MDTTRTFAVTWDYRCPFARNAHEHVLDALAGGAPWEVTFLPFSLDQMHVPEDEPAVWKRPSEFPGLLANQAGTWVRDHEPHVFPDVHRALFSARHDEGHDLRELDVVAGVLKDHGADADAALAAIDSGDALALLRADHEGAEQEHHTWGVPTFIVDGHAAFVRLMHRPEGNADLARDTIERVLDLAGSWADLNELKHTRIPR